MILISGNGEGHVLALGGDVFGEKSKKHLTNSGGVACEAHRNACPICKANDRMINELK